MNIHRCISKCVEETNFFDDQKKLDTMYYLMKGLTYQQIADKIGRRVSYVQRVMNFLRSNGLLYWGRWVPNVYKIGMKMSIAFLNWKDRKVPEDDNFDYTTYVGHVRAGKTKVFVVYTYPKDDREKIKGEKGEEVTPFYHTHTRFTVPFFKKIDLVREFDDVFNSMENDKTILTGTPSFETELIHDDPVTVYICRYAMLLPELAPGILTDRLEKDFKNIRIDVTYDDVKRRLEEMKQEEIIFPRNALYLNPLFYQSALVKIKSREIYKIMGTFNQFNMLTQLALTCDSEIFYLYIQYPFYQFSEVMEILDELDSKSTELDSKSTVYVSTKYVMSDTIYYQWTLKKYLESKSEG